MAMLQAITELLIKRASNSVKTTLMKVKSHTGIQGNEHADQLANAAAELIAEGRPVDRDAAQSHCENFNNKFWLADGDDQASLQNVRKLDDALQNEIHTKLKLGQSNQDSIYFKSWQQIQRVTAAKYSNAFWDMPAITEPMKINLLKSRCGELVLWNKKLAFMLKSYNSSAEMLQRRNLRQSCLAKYQPRHNRLLPSCQRVYQAKNRAALTVS